MPRFTFYRNNNCSTSNTSTRKNDSRYFVEKKIYFYMNLITAKNLEKSLYLSSEVPQLFQLYRIVKNGPNLSLKQWL